MAATSLRLVVDVANNRLLESVSSASSAPTPSFAQGDIVVVELHLVTGVASLASAAVEAAIPDTSTVRVGVGIPGATPAALANLSAPLAGNLGRAGTLSLNTAEIASLLGASASKPATLEVEIVDADGSVSTVFQGPCTVLNDLIDEGGTPPQQLPSLAVDVAILRRDLDALRGGVPLANAWENPMDSAFFESGNVTITGGIPAALYGTGPINFVANAIPDWTPDTLDISGVLQAGTATNCTAFFTFIDSVGGELLPGGGRRAVSIPSSGNVAFSIASLPVPAGATRLAFGYEVIDSQQPCEFSSGLVSIGLTAHANLSELTAEALDDILAAKAQALSDAGETTTYMGQANAARIAAEAAKGSAASAASDAGTAKGAAETSAALAAQAAASIPLLDASRRIISNMGVAVSSNGTFRSAITNGAGMLILWLKDDTSTWGEARWYWGSGDTGSWPMYRLVPTNKAFEVEFPVYVRNQNGSTDSEAYILFGNPVALATSAGAIDTAGGFGFKLTYLAGSNTGYVVTPLYRRSGDGSTQSGTPVTLTRGDSYDYNYRALTLYVSADGNGSMTFGYYAAGVRTVIQTVTGATFPSNVVNTITAFQARHTSGSTLDAVWAFDKSATLNIHKR